MNVLMSHEKEAADIIARQPRILLFDAMGVGKTVSVLEGLKRASEGVVGAYKCVVCAPNTILGQWVDEITSWLGPYGFTCVVATGSPEQREIKYNYFESVNDKVILLTNYSFLVKDSYFKTLTAGLLILDEGYLIRNKSTRAYQFLTGFINSFNKVIVLSGNTESFTVQQFYDIANLLFPGEIVKGDKSLMQEALGERYISRDLSSVFNVSEPEVVKVAQDLSIDQKRLLSKLAIKENQAMKTDNYNAAVFYRKRLSILNSPRILDATLECSPKEVFLLWKLKTLNGKCVIYCPDRKFFKLIRSDLNIADIDFVVVSGEMPVSLRERSLNLFTHDPSVKCLLISGVGKFGLNLQVASTLICMGVPKGLFDLEQMLGRLNRINQTEKVVCFIPYHLNTEEENLVKKLDSL